MNLQVIVRLAFSYIRFSNPDQALGDSLRRQLAAAEAYAREHGLTLDTSLRDLGISAFTGSNSRDGALGRFRAAVESGKVPRGSTLIVESLDRLSREDVLSAMRGLLELIESGITVVTLLDGQSYSRESVKQDWTRLMLSVVLMARAHEESATKSVRVAKAWGAKRAKAVESQAAMTARCVAWVQVVGNVRAGTARYALIPERAAIVRQIFELTAEGHGQRQVATRLNAESVPPWGKGDGWQPSYITKILGTRAVLGFYQPHRKPRRDEKRTPDGPEIPGYYPAAVDEGLYYRALAARAGRRGKGGPKGKGVASLFSGIAKCASCGRSMVHLNKGQPPKGGRYLVCDGHLRHLPCDAPATWRYERAEAAVIRGLRHLDLAPILGHGMTVRADARAKVTTIAAQLLAAEGRRDRLVAALGDVDDPAIVKQLRQAAADVGRLKTEHAEAEKAAGVAEHSGLDFPNRVALIAELFDRMSTLEGSELYDLRMLLAQELRRVLQRLRFTPTNILADRKLPDGKKPGTFEWLVGIPLIESAEATADADDTDVEDEPDAKNWLVGRANRGRASSA